MSKNASSVEGNRIHGGKGPNLFADRVAWTLLSDPNLGAEGVLPLFNLVAGVTLAAPYVLVVDRQNSLLGSP